MQQEESKDSGEREVLLFEPGSGKAIASALVEISFSSHSGGCVGDVLPPPTESSHIADAANTSTGRLSEVKKAVLENVDVCISCVSCRSQMLGRSIYSSVVSCPARRVSQHTKNHTKNHGNDRQTFERLTVKNTVGAVENNSYVLRGTSGPNASHIKIVPALDSTSPVVNAYCQASHI